MISVQKLCVTPNTKLNMRLSRHGLLKSIFLWSLYKIQIANHLFN